jgi:TorA maturation chaperone TorD
LGDIAGFYRAFGLDVSDRVRERVDHISVELEFMAFLVYKEAYAQSTLPVGQGQAGDEKPASGGRAEICREAQRKFLNDHLGRWVQDFTRRLEKKAQDGPYSRLARLTERFLAIELEAFGAKPLQAEGVTQIPWEPWEGCTSCESKDVCFPVEESS